MRLGSNGSGKTMLALVACTAQLLGAAPALAQTQASDSSPAKNKDPNRIICERIQETGSRLASKRVCMTALQWEDQRRRDRENLQDAQNRRTEPSG
jgi:invasion protein IalB